MFDKFDKYITDFAMEDFDVDYWYDEGVGIVEEMICKFDESDWEKLAEVIPDRTVEWNKRLAYCMHDSNNVNQLKVLLDLVEINDNELFEIVVDSLRGFTSKESIRLIRDNLHIMSRIEELMPKVGDVTRRIFEVFLKLKTDESV